MPSIFGTTKKQEKSSSDNKNNGNEKLKANIKRVVILFSIKALIIILIPVMILISITMFWDELKDQTVSKISSTVRETEVRNTLQVDKDNRQYQISDEFLERIKEVLEDTMQVVKVDDDLLLKFYEAEVRTSFPDLRKRDQIETSIQNNEQLQGCIQFNRTFSDGTSQILEYMDYDQFRIELAKFGCYLQDSDGNSVSQEQIYKTKSEVDENYDNLKTYFTLDEEYNLIIATKNSTTIQTSYSDYAKQEGKVEEDSYEYTVEYRKINYQTSVEKYSMPIEFSLIMLQVSQNPEYCEAMVDLVKDTKIVLGIQDNENTTIITEKYDYVAEFEFEKTIDYYEEVKKPIEDPNTNTIVPDENNLDENNLDENTLDENNNQTENENTQQNTNSGGNGGTGGTQSPHKPGHDIYEVPLSFSSNYWIQTLSSIHPEIVKDGDGKAKPSQNLDNSQTNSTQLNETVDENSSDTEYEIEKQEGTSNPKGTYIKEKNMEAPYRTITQTIVESSIDICVMQVDNWILETNVTYTKLQENDSMDPVITNPPDDEEYIEVEDKHNLLSTLQDDVPEGAVVTNTQETIKEKQTQKELQVQTTTKQVKFIKSTPNTIQKEEKFLSLLSIDPSINSFNKNDISKNTILLKYEDITGKDVSPETNILLYSYKMFELLAKYQKTQGYEEIMRYLLYVYTGNSYGTETLDFSIYDAGEFNSVYGSTGSIGGIQGQIYNYLRSKGMSQIGAAAILGNIQRESSFVPGAINGDNPHYGLCQWGTGTRFDGLNKKAQEMKGNWEDLEVQLEFLWQELETTYSSTKDELMNATDLYSAVDYFARHYEVCGDYDTEVPKRYGYAQHWYEISNNQVDNSNVEDITKYNLNVYKGYIEYKQIDYKTIPPQYQATASPAGTIKDKGCMPTSISIILSGLGIKSNLGIAFTPETLISSGTINHINGGSSTAANAKNTFTKCGLTASNMKKTSAANAENDILTNLRMGNPILIHASKGYYTSEGHFMTLIDADQNQVYLSNPSSRSKTGWVSLKQLINEKVGNVDWYMVVSR